MKRICFVLFLCVAVACSELDYGTKPNPEPEAPGIIDEHFVYGSVDYGEGIEIDHVVWAPVNCGVTERKYGMHYPIAKAWTVCPDGWRLPLATEIDDLMKNGSGLTLHEGTKGCWFSGNKEYSGDVTAIFFPFAGYARNTDILEEGTNGWYYAAEGNRLHQLRINSSKVIIDDSKANACAIRCVRGSNEDVLPGAGDKYCENKESYGYDVKIGDFIWAPVNAGISSSANGMSYTYEAAKESCPSGFHLATLDEFNQLTENITSVTSYGGISGCWASGDRAYSPEIPAIFLPFDENQIYWTASSNRNYAYFSNLSEIDYGDKMKPGYARCVRGTGSKDDGASDNVVGGVEKYVVNGVDYGYSVQIGNLVWAPINSGFLDGNSLGSKYIYLGKEYIPWGKFDLSDSRDACPSGYRIPTDNEFTALLKNTSRITTVDGQNGRWCSGDLEFSSANPAIFIPLETQDGHSLEYWTSFGTYRNPYCFDGEKTYIQDPGTGCHVRCVKGVDNRKYEVPGAAGKYNDTEFDCVEMSGMIWAPFDCEGTFSYEEAMLACPFGYRLPLREEFEALQSSFSGSYYGVQGCWLGTSPVYDDHLSALFFPKSSDSYWVAGKNKWMNISYCWHFEDNDTFTFSLLDCSEKHKARCIKGDKSEVEVKDKFPIDVDAWTKEAYIRGSETGGTIYGVKYRRIGEEEWFTYNGEQPVDNGRFVAHISGLLPATRYECFAYTETDESEICLFTTESAAQLPNNSFEHFSLVTGADYYKWYNPACDDHESREIWWASGNGEGKDGVAGTGAFGLVMIYPDCKDKMDGGWSVRCESKSLNGVLACGNFFTGRIAKIVGWTGVSMNYGRPWTTRPKALKVWCKYQSGVIDLVGKKPVGDNTKIGDNDRCEIAISVGNWDYRNMGGTAASPVYVNTTNGIYYTEKSPGVIGFGHFVSNESFDWTLVEIPLDYKTLTEHPTHIIVTCTASYLGDYLTGSSQSKLWIDKMELIY